MRHRQQGIALILVLLTVALIAVLAVTMSGRLHGQIMKMQTMQDVEQANLYLLSAENLTKRLLKQELDAAEDVVHLGQNWATQQPPFPVEGGFIQGSITDLSSCFNLNSLAAVNSETLLERRKRQFKALLLSLGINDYNADVMTDSLADWLDSDTNISGTYGAEDPDYEALPTPYQAGNTLLAHKSELRLIRGFTNAHVRAIDPFVCVRPFSTNGEININTIPVDRPHVLSAIFEGQLSLTAAAQILQNRPPKGYAERDDIISDGRLITAAADAQTAANMRASNSRSDSGSDSGTDGNNNGNTPGATQNQNGGNANDENNDNTDNNQENNQNNSGALDDIVITSDYFELNARVRYGDLVQQGVSVLKFGGSEPITLYRGLGRGQD